MTLKPDPLPSDLASALAALQAERDARQQAEARAANWQAEATNAQADAALATERGINQDINATLGGNWQRSGTLGLQDQAMRQQASGFADRVLNSCMRAKGFTREG